MFGYVMANPQELRPEQRERYLGCYCGISAFLACVVVCRANLLYGVLMIVAAIPSSIAGARYMKLLYHLSLEQINGERQKGYLQAIATSRSYAQSIRFFHAGARLKEKYQRLWKTMFEARRDMNRRRSILTSLLEFLPEAVAAWVGVDISMQILAGSATVGATTPCIPDWLPSFGPASPFCSAPSCRFMTIS